MNSSDASTPPAVIIVDDDGAVRGSLQFALELEGFTTRAYADSDDFFDHLDAAAAACLVVDYRLPGLNGLELIEALRGRGLAGPAILITSQPKPAVRRKAAALGVSLIEKPLLGNALVDEIRRLTAPSAALVGAGPVQRDDDHRLPES